MVARRTVTKYRQMLKIELDKSSRFTDWARRPLSDNQLTYALATYSLNSPAVAVPEPAAWALMTSKESIASTHANLTFKMFPFQWWRLAPRGSRMPGGSVPQKIIETPSMTAEQPRT